MKRIEILMSNGPALEDFIIQVINDAKYQSMTGEKSSIFKDGESVHNYLFGECEVEVD